MGRNPPKKRCVVHSTGKPKKAIAASGFYLKEVFSERRMFYEGKNMGAIAKKINDEFKLLPPEVRLPYEKLAEADLARYWAEMAHVEKKNYKIATRSSIKNVKEINDSLTDEQREAIKRVGFGSMLDIDLGNLRHSICLWIAETFNGSSNSFNFHGERYPFNPDDVETMIGLKNTGERIVLRESNDEDYLRVKASFGPNNVISFTKLSSKLRENHSADDDFVRSYLMNMFAYFLFPNTDAGIKAYYLQPLIHVDSIASYNWAQHVFELLRAGMIEYNCRRKQLEKITETESKRVTITFRGCMSLLMILFLDQINGPNDFNREHYEVPSIMYWNVDNIKNKVRRVGVLYQYQESCNVIPKFYDYPPDYKLVDDEKPLKK